MMKKEKCDKCGVKGFGFRIVGKPKKRMKVEELVSNHTRIGDNKTFEKRYCGVCY